MEIHRGGQPEPRPKTETDGGGSGEPPSKTAVGLEDGGSERVERVIEMMGQLKLGEFRDLIKKIKEELIV